MASVAHDLGLCINCENLPTCSFVRGVRSAVLYCEEFHFVVSDARTLPGSECRDGLGSAPRVAKQGSGPAPAGLCADCASGGSCRLSRRDGGVWHCEEYC